MKLPAGSASRFALAAAFGLLKFAPGLFFLIVASGLLGPDVRQGLEWMFASLWAGALGGDTKDFAAAGLWFLFFVFASFAIPLLVSFLVLRRRRYVLVTLVSSLLLWGLNYAYSTYVAIPADVRRSFEDEKRQRESVAIDTLTYELADRMPVKPIPHFGDGFRKLRLLLVLNVVEPGVTRVTVKFVGHQSARDIRKSRTLLLGRGRQQVEFEFVTEDFTYLPSVWVVPGSNPNLHPSWLEGWKCYAEVEVERPFEPQLPGKEQLWRRNGGHTFVLHGVHEHDAPGVAGQP